MAKVNEQERLLAITQIEREYWGRAGIVVAGMDEVGRGPLAGPVVTACVALPPSPLIAYVNDSKKLTALRREKLYTEITTVAQRCALAWIGPDVIDEINILQATRRAFVEAYQNAGEGITDVLVDAVKDLPISARQHPYVHGDERSYLIAAASIVAKVERDRYMEAIHEEYPQYGFVRNKGYGTAEHIAALKAHGPCPIHRQSFIKGILAENQIKEKLGDRGEGIALRFLEKKGYTLIKKNARYGHNEIDLIMQQEGTVVFVEVKSRSSMQHGLGREAVDRRKQRLLTAAAQAFLMDCNEDVSARFDVVEVNLQTGEIAHIENAFMAIL